MDAKMLNAIQGSIEKWDRIIKSTKALDRGVDNCPLCKIYDGDVNRIFNCLGCPVKDKTGRDNCMETPYYDWIRHHKKLHKMTSYFCHRIAGCKGCLTIAKRERDFLKGLLLKEVL